MTLFHKIAGFFSPESDKEYSNSNLRASDISLVAFAASLASSPDLLREQHDALKNLESVDEKEQSKQLGKIYLEIEAKLSESDPGREFTPASIKQQILKRIELNDFDRPFVLLFAPPLQQQICLSILVLDRVIQNAKQTVGTTVMDNLILQHLGNTALDVVAIKDGHITFQPVAKVVMSLPEEQLRPLLSDLTRLFQDFHDKLASLQGLAWADQVFNTAYMACKADFADYLETMPVVSSMMPEGLMEDERLGLLSRETLTQKVKEATRQLIAEKASVERKVVERTRELHNEQAKLKASIEALSLGFLIADRENKIITKNQSLVNMMGTGGEGLRYLKDLNGTLKNFDIVAHNDSVRSAGKATTFTDIGMGTKILQLFMAPVNTDESDAGLIGTVIVFEDITEAKVLERSKDEFFSIASHELRTPLTAIRGNAALIEEYFLPKLKEPELGNMIGDIKESSVRLIGIVNDFLDMSRIEQGKMQIHFTAVSLDKIIEKVFYEMREVLHNKHLYLNMADKTLDKLPKVWADEISITQILYNLIGNAVKFTEKGGVTVECTHDDTYVHVAVSDTGRGISLQNQKLLFHKFQQAGDSLLTRDTTRGTGLGLYISKLMADSMKGAIALKESVENKGSTFVFSIPIATEEQIEAAKKAPKRLAHATSLDNNMHAEEFVK